MDNQKVTELLKITPDAMREMIKGLKSDDHWAVYVYLLENEGREITIPQIANDLTATKDEVVTILKDLGNSGLVSKHARDIKQVINHDQVFVQATRLGEDLFDAMFDVVIPKKNNL
jgi:predicted transcriptional regulator